LKPERGDLCKNKGSMAK